MSEPLPTPEFSHEVDLGKLPRGGKHYRLEANEIERERIANRLGVISVNALSGDMHVTASAKTIAIHGRVVAALTRECVASLEEMSETVEEPFKVDFVRRADAIDPQSAEEDLDAPDVYEAPILDIGDLLVQQLSLAMAPFPRKEGAKSLAEKYGAATQTSPFAVLQGKIGKTE